MTHDSRKVTQPLFGQPSPPLIGSQVILLLTHHAPRLLHETRFSFTSVLAHTVVTGGYGCHYSILSVMRRSNDRIFQRSNEYRLFQSTMCMRCLSQLRPLR